MDKIYRLYKEEDFLEDDFIKNAFEEMVEQEGLHDFAKAVMISDEDVGNLGDYDRDVKLITIYPSIILCDKGKVDNKRLLALQVLRHELEHARNTMLIHQGREDIESTVLRSDFRNYIRENHVDVDDSIDPFDRTSYLINKKKCYQINPDERLADIRAWKYVINLLKNDRRSEDLALARKMLQKAYRRGYRVNKDNISAPTFKFLKKLEMYNLKAQLEERIRKQRYCLETRLNLGLPIVDEAEDENVLRKIKRTI